MTPGIGAAISGASNIASGVIGQIFAKKNSERQLSQQKELQNYQYSQDVDMWNKQNAYNSPLQQMERYKEAGLNPNLIYGSGSSAGNAATMPKYNAPTAPMRENSKIQTGDMIQQYQNIQMQQKQIDLVESQIKNTDAQSTAQIIQNKYLDDQYGYDIVKRDIGNQKGWKELDNLELDRIQRDYRNKLNKSGLHINDPLPLRILIQAGIGLEDIKRIIKTYKF